MGCLFTPGLPSLSAQSYECPRTTGFAAATPSSCAAPAARASTSRAVKCSRPPPPLERSRPSPQILNTPLPCPKPGQLRGPGGGGWLAKFLQAAAPRARREPESIFMQLYAQVKARSAACAHAHTRIYTHTHTSMHSLTHLALGRKLLHSFSPGISLSS